MSNNSALDHLDSEDLLASNPLASLSSVEVTQHIELCIKLAGENKINQKNCFQLHLISMLKNSTQGSESPDFQLASLILQASSKIYSGRVECLYKDTFTFYSQLHSLLNKDSRGTDNTAENNDEEQPAPSRKKKERQKGKEKFLGNAKNLTCNLNLQSKPHDCFELIDSAFSTSYAGPKLLNVVHFESDSADISFTTSKCFKTCGHHDSEPENTRTLSRTLKATFEECNSPFLLRPVPSRPNTSFGNVDNDSFVIADCVIPEEPIPITPVNVEPPRANINMDAMINQFSALDITSDQFANDVAEALNSSTGVIDVANLPPNSILKKVLRDRPTQPKARPLQTTKKEKPKFFSTSKEIPKNLFSSKRNISKIDSWTEDNCSNKSVDINKFFKEPDSDAETLQDALNPEESAEFLYKVLMSRDQIDFSRYFSRQRKQWRRFLTSDQRPKPIIRPSMFGASYEQDQEQENLSYDSAPGQDLASDPANEDLIPDSEPNNISFSSAPCDNLSGQELPLEPDDPRNRKNNPYYSDDLSQILVKVPETVKPINIHYQKKEIVINTDHLKKLLSHTIDDELSKEKSCAFLDVFYKVKTKYLAMHKEEVNQQHVFVFLLILANEKVLLLENDANGNITIQADTSNERNL